MNAVVVGFRPHTEGKSVSVAGAGVYASPRCGDRERTAANGVGRKVYHGKMSRLGICNEQTPNGHLAVIIGHCAVVIVVVVIIMVVVMAVFGELKRVHTVAKRDYLRWICTGVLYEVIKPDGLKAKTDGQHEICVGHFGNITGSRHQIVRVATR